MSIESIFEAAGVRGFLHARRVGPESGEVGVRADEPVVLASVVKVPLVLEFARQVAAGQLGAPRDVLRTILEDEGRPLRALDPLRTTASTPREMTRLLSLIWCDEAGPASACAWVRELMELQVSWHRLAAAFDPDVAVAGKTGTLPGIRNEIGVASYPDGEHYAVAVFTVGGHEHLRLPRIDRAIGEAARTAVDLLRARPRG